MRGGSTSLLFKSKALTFSQDGFPYKYDSESGSLVQLAVRVFHEGGGSTSLMLKSKALSQDGFPYKYDSGSGSFVQLAV